MKRSIQSILVFPAIFLVVSCTRGVRMPKELVVIDSLVDANPDSALVLLDRMDAGKENTSFRMYMELLRGKAKNKAFVNFTSDSTMLLVASYFDRHGDANQRMLAHYVLGCAYRDMGSAPRALEQYQRAVELADTTSASCDLPTLMRVHSQMADLYYRMHLVKLTNEEDSIAEKLAWQIGDTLSALICEDKTCTYLIEEKKYDEGFIKTKQLHKAYLQHNFKDAAAITCINLVKVCLEKKDYSNAKKYLDSYESSGFFMSAPNKIVGGLSALHLYKGLYYKETNKPDSAEACFQKALSIGHPHRNSVLIYKELLECYHKTNKPDSVLKYAGLYAAEKERKYNEDMGQTALQMTSLYDYSVEQKIAKEEAQRTARWRTWVLILGLVVSVLCCLLFLFRYRSEQRKRHISDLQLQLHKVREKMWEEQALLQSLMQEKQQIESKIIAGETKANQLLAEKEELIREQNRNIVALEEQLADLSHKVALLNGTRTESALLQSEIVKRVLHLADTPFKKMTPLDWKKLTQEVDKKIPTFRHEMNKRKTLSEDEYRLCMLSLIGVSPSSANALLERDSTYATNTRKRLHKKVFGVEGTAIDFDRRLHQML